MTFDHGLDGTHFYAVELYDRQPTASLVSLLAIYRGDLEHARYGKDTETEDWVRQQVRSIRRTLLTRGVLD